MMQIDPDAIYARLRPEGRLHWDLAACQEVIAQQNVELAQLRSQHDGPDEGGGHPHLHLVP